MQEAELRKLQPAQYINHFPGSFTLGRKDYLWRNFQRCQREHPREVRADAGAGAAASPGLR
jgi:hypothetical protein